MKYWEIIKYELKQRWFNGNAHDFLMFVYFCMTTGIVGAWLIMENHKIMAIFYIALYGVVLFTPEKK